MLEPDPSRHDLNVLMVAVLVVCLAALFVVLSLPPAAHDDVLARAPTPVIVAP